MSQLNTRCPSFPNLTDPLRRSSVAPREPQVDKVNPDVTLVARDKNFHDGLVLQSIRAALGQFGTCVLSDFPGSATGFPKLVEVLAIPLGVHRVPKAAMLENIQFTIARQFYERISFQYAPFLFAEIF